LKNDVTDAVARPGFISDEAAPAAAKFHVPEDGSDGREVQENERPKQGNVTFIVKCNVCNCQMEILGTYCQMENLGIVKWKILEELQIAQILHFVLFISSVVGFLQAQ
jgi:hypothetical protein